MDNTRPGRTRLGFASPKVTNTRDKGHKHTRTFSNTESREQIRSLTVGSLGFSWLCGREQGDPEQNNGGEKKKEKLKIMAATKLFSARVCEPISPPWPQL
jgi:hypothetical protein